jgi:RimJ/RimL family protein N-acetyltransferase
LKTLEPMKTYACLKQSVISQGGYELVPLRRKDIFSVKHWRNAQMLYLRQQQLLSDEEQLRYYDSIVVPTFGQAEPKILLFSFLKAGELIGYGGPTNLDWVSRRAEVSFLLETGRAGNREIACQEFSIFLHLLKRVVFEDLGFNRLFSETYDLRPWLVEVLESRGFVFEGRMRQHVFKGGRFVDSLLHGCLRESLERDPSNRDPRS